MSHDELARQLILAVQEDLKTWYDVPRIESELIGALYLQLRDVMRRWTELDEAGAVDELALAVYLTATAWQSPADQPTALLPLLRRDIAEAMRAQSKGDRP